jgi:hypothetical protein
MLDRRCAIAVSGKPVEAGSFEDLVACAGMSPGGYAVCDAQARAQRSFSRR